MAIKTYSVLIEVEVEDGTPDSMAICGALDMWNENTPFGAPELRWIGDEGVFEG